MQIGNNLQTPGMKLKCPSVPKQHLQLPQAKESVEQHPHTQPHSTWRPGFSSSLGPSCNLLQIFLRTTRFLRSLCLSTSLWGRRCKGLAVPVFSSKSHAAQIPNPASQGSLSDPESHWLMEISSPRRTPEGWLGLCSPSTEGDNW